MYRALDYLPSNDGKNHQIAMFMLTGWDNAVDILQAACPLNAGMRRRRVFANMYLYMLSERFQLVDAALNS